MTVDVTIANMWQTVTLGFGYLPGSIRVRFGDAGAVVEELDASTGIIRVDVPRGYDGPIAVDFQRTVLRAGEPSATREIGTADVCIYCGARSDLRDEHVIPYGLEGTFVLRRASCGSCASKTSKIELAVLRDALLPARTALALRTRHKRSRGPTLSVTEVDAEGRGGTRQLLVAEHPTYIALPIFDTPARLRDASVPNLVVKGGWTKLVGGSTLPEASARFGAKRVGVEISLDVYAFARMLGKIAHGFVAASDLGDVATELPAAIFEDAESIGWWVGGAPDVTVSGDGLHGVHVSLVDGMVQVRVRLFAQLGGPEYLVIAGRLIQPTPDMGPSVTVEGATPLRNRWKTDS